MTGKDLEEPIEEESKLMELPSVPDSQLQGLGVFFDIEGKSESACLVRGG